MNNWLNQLERKYGRFGIPNLTNILVGGQILVPVSYTHLTSRKALQGAQRRVCVSPFQLADIGLCDAGAL